MYKRRERPYQKIKNDTRTLVLAGDQKSIITLNETAFVIWETCDGLNLRELVKKILELYKLPEEEYKATIENDCQNILTYLAENGLIKEYH